MRKLSEQARALESMIKCMQTGGDSEQKKINEAILALMKNICQAVEALKGEQDFCCPSCGESVYIELDKFETEEVIVCPKCKEPLNIVTQEF